jgi:hypothetical protein
VSDEVIFRVHAVQRMFERNISEEDVKHILITGESIEEYPTDRPYPSRLVLGWRKRRPLHVVAAYNNDEEQTIVVTVYEPDPAQWTADFRRRTS